MQRTVNAHAIQMRIQGPVTRLLARHSVDLLRISLGLVFLGFGVLKFVPGLSPAEGLVERTTEALSFGIIPGAVGLVLVAMMETAIGICLITGKKMGLGLALLGMAMVGFFSPVVLFPDDLFSREYNAPTLEGQYVLKDVVLFAAGLVVMASVLLGRPVVEGDGVADDEEDGAAR